MAKIRGLKNREKGMRFLEHMPARGMGLRVSCQWGPGGAQKNVVLVHLRLPKIYLS